MRCFAPIAFGFIATLFLSGIAGAQSISTNAEHAILVDTETDAVLFEKAADTPFPPASMSKMMTVYLAFDMISNGVFSLDDTTTVSTSAWRAWRNRGSTMFLNAGDEVTLAQLLRGIIVQSGNDACVVMAEMLAGSTDAYVGWMNDKAREIGLEDSYFVNVNGWPAEGHVVTARDLATLAERTIEDFPELYSLYAEREFAYGTDASTGKAIVQPNRNPLYYSGFAGADGLKTGHTEEAGYGFTGSAVRDGRRLIVVVSGLESEAERRRESEKLLNYGFRYFDTYHLFEAGEVVDEAVVWLGRQPTVPLVVQEAVTLTLSRRDRNQMEVALTFMSPLASPVEKDQPVATLKVRAPELGERVYPVVAGDTVSRQGGVDKIRSAFNYLLFGAPLAEPSAQ